MVHKPAALASPGTLLEKQIPNLLNQKLRDWDIAVCILKKPCRGFWCQWKLTNHLSWGAWMWIEKRSSATAVWKHSSALTGWWNSFEYPFFHSENFGSYQHQSCTPHKIISVLLYTPLWRRRRKKPKSSGLLGFSSYIKYYVQKFLTFFFLFSFTVIILFI